VPRSTLEATAAAAAELHNIIAAVASQLERDLDALTARAADAIHDEMPELGTHARVTARTLAAVRASFEGFLDFMRGGIASEKMQVSPEIADYGRAFVHRGIGLPSAIRCFRLGHAQMWKAWTDAIERAELAPEQRAAVVDLVSTSMFEFVDRTTTAVVEQYELEREHWTRSAEARRAEGVAEILAGRSVEQETASRALGYDLRRWHIGLVLWSSDEAEQRMMELQSAAADLSERLAGPGRPLILSSTGSTLWAWAGARERPEPGFIDDVLAQSRRNDIRVAVGEPAHGLDGFRRTHESAVLTRRVMRLTSRPASVPQRFRSLSLLSLLSADAEQMRRFVADELGELDADDETTVRLRATLQIYYEERTSAVKTGRRLGIHTNTVNYRIRHCAELIGHPVRERRAEIETALLLKQSLGGQAFEQAPPRS
jgi:DNA-binding PucR family transcriptional regulator